MVQPLHWFIACSVIYAYIPAITLQIRHAYNILIFKLMAIVGHDMHLKQQVLVNAYNLYESAC